MAGQPIDDISNNVVRVDPTKRFCRNRKIKGGIYSLCAPIFWPHFNTAGASETLSLTPLVIVFMAYSKHSSGKMGKKKGWEEFVYIGSFLCGGGRLFGDTAQIQNACQGQAARIDIGLRGIVCCGGGGGGLAHGSGRGSGSRIVGGSSRSGRANTTKVDRRLQGARWCRCSGSGSGSGYSLH